ncbi:MAG: BspA family leucine-rich repeat surface protein [Flammeovirgaceae bacterium]|nr:BspA family leucine-rich repeat surface protein [Flammeovirgaceae bacterium]
MTFLKYCTGWMLLSIISFKTYGQITVTSVNDAGPGTLRQAVIDANTNPGPDAIVFDPSLVGMTISLDAVVVVTSGNGDGTSIEGDINSDGTPDITIQPSGSNYSGIEIQAANCVVQHLHMQGFLDAGRAALLINGAGAIDNGIYANYLGTNVSGNAAGTTNHSGIYINGGATGTVIGDGTANGRNVIGGNSFGIRIANASNNTTITGNYIGIGIDGATAIGNARGIDMFNVDGCVIGVSDDLPNVIGTTGGTGAYLNGATGTTIANNYIGVDATGLLDRGNDTGIWLRNGSDGTQIGTGIASGRNILAAGNNGHGIWIEDSDNTYALGNYIGLGSDGSTTLPNNFGVRASGTSTGTHIGDGSAGGRNIISGNFIGVSAGGSGTAYVFGNYIGTDATGTLDRGNSNAGVSIAGGSGQVGGNTSGQGNVISGNSYGIGVSIGGFDILGNYIGTNAAGTAALPNDDRGIRLSVGSGTNIGDGTAGGANFISGNTMDGILIENGSTTGNTIQMNYIGLQADGSSPLGNGGNGVLIESDANGNTLSGNSIAHNAANGVEIGEVFSTGINNNLLTQNSIYNNGGNGILITNGAQNGIAPPTITSTTNGLITGTADPLATIEIFADGADEGEQYLDFTNADGSGNFSHQIAVASINPGLNNISVTQTSGTNTSEFGNLPLSLAFITTWSTTDGQITIPTTGGGYTYDVTWTNLTNAGVGDGSATGQTGDFPIPGLANGDIYQVEITGSFPRIFFDSNGDAGKILTVEQWGNIAWTSMNNAFYGCSNLTIPATDAPNLSGVTDMSGMFRGASSLNQSMNSWDVSSVTNMEQLFAYATSFNQPLNSWNVINVTNMASMFESATAFNQPLPWDVDNVTRMDAMFSLAVAFNQDIGSWKVGQVNNMNNMFSGANSFNQDIGSWNVGNVTNMQTMFYDTPFNQDIGGWNVSKVLTMQEMFLDAGAFNQDISAWDVKKVINMQNMFNFAGSFNQSLAAWDISSVTTMSGMLSNSNLSTANYDATLIGWSTLSGGETLIPSGIALGASNLTYCAGEPARAALMATHSWTFTGDSKNCPPGPEIALYEGTDNTGTAIPSGQVVPVHFSHLKLGQDKDIVFAIENTGTAALTINSITLTGTDFTILSPPTSVTPGATENFTVRLSGATKGIYNAFVSIDNDDVDESTYWFSVTGTVGQLDPKVYWTDDLTFPTEDQINRSDLDGNNFQQYYSGFEPKISGIAVDTTNNMLFWTSASKATIRCARMDEGGFTTYGTILDESGGSSRPFNGLDIDAAAQKIYFTSEWTNEIRRINFDGTGSEVLVSINGPKDIALDVAGGKMYYVVLNLSTPELWRADLDGSNQQLLHSSGTTLFLGVALDLVNGHVYWTESAGGIERSDLDGSNLTFVGTANSPGGIALNVGEQKIYYVDTSTPAIRRVNFDGTGDVAIQSGTNVFNPVHIDIDPRFPPVVGPEINVFAGNDNTGTPITDGQATPIDLGNAVQGNDLVQTFAIENTGTADLNVSSITASGSDYSVASTIATVAAGATETFTVTLSGANAGTFNTSLDIASDDADENPFTFDITGTISQPCLPITAGTPSVQSTINVPSNVDVVAASTINNGDIITVSILQAPSKGSAIILADNTIGYTAQEGTVGADSFPYRICNQCGLCSDGTITVDIQNEPPVFAPPAVPVEVVAGQTVTIDLATLFSDLNGNLDLASFSGFSSSWSASPSYDGATGTLVLDYANATPAGPSDEVGFTLCDQLGACTQATLSIAIDGSITAYNGISPNGDGINDYFILKNIQFLEPDNKVNIYNRWGDKVFEMEGYNPDIPEKRFNGISDKGKALPSGVYFYKVEFSSGREDLTGYLTIKK